MKILPLMLVATLATFMVTGCEQKQKAQTKAPTQVETRVISIGTGVVTGTYYPTGGAICRMMKGWQKKTGISCAVKSTEGSVYNVNNIRTGQLDFAISQSDTAFYAYKGQGIFQDTPVTKLRSVMAIYPELLALVVRKDSDIKNLLDIKGKRINIDAVGSGTHMTVKEILKANNISVTDFKTANELPSSENPTMLKDKKIDGYFGMFGHPTASIKDVAHLTDMTLVPIDGEVIDGLIADKPYYTKGIMPADIYKNVNKDVPSIGVKAVLVTHADMEEVVVRAVVKSVLSNFSEFKASHPAYKNITKESLLDGLAIPQHPAATAVFKEKGISVITTE